LIEAGDKLGHSGASEKWTASELKSPVSLKRDMREPNQSEKRERARIRRLSKRQVADEVHVMPGYQTHEPLFQIAKMLPTDYQPYGQMDRENFADCSCGCRWYHKLAGTRGQDWGACANPRSPRSGLLTFEHQGCPQFEEDPRDEFLDTASGKRERKRFEDREEELRQWRKAHSFRIAGVTQRRVGIFWLAGSRLLRDTSPLSEAEEYRECLTHPTSHIEHWKHLQQIGMVPSDIEYEEHPRGRVVVNVLTERFAIYADRCILKRPSVVSRIVKAMHLIPSETEIKTDDHYRCFKCLGRSR
jgi:hypothetical protein